MKKLVLVALTAMVAMAASGCIITSGDDDPVDEFAAITAKWSIKNLATNDNTLPCPPGINTTALYNQVIDENGNAIGSPIIDLFTCSDFQGTATDLDPDIYQSWIELTTGSGGTVYAQSLSAIVDVIDTDKTFETTILEDGGYFELSWTLRAANGGGELTCAQAAATGVSILATLTTGGSDTDDILDCAPGYGVTAGLPMGTYVVSIDAINSANEPLGPDPVLKNNVVIGDQNAVTDLGHVDLPIE